MVTFFIHVLCVVDQMQMAEYACKLKYTLRIGEASELFDSKCRGLLQNAMYKSVGSGLVFFEIMIFGFIGLRSEELFHINVTRSVLDVRRQPYRLIHDVADKSVHNTFFVNIVVCI